MAEAALSRAQDFQVSHADFRFERVRGQDIRVRDGRLQGASDTEDVGFAVRVILNGAWGFASGVVLGTESAVQVAEAAVRTAQVAAAMTTRRWRWRRSRRTTTSPGSAPTTSTPWRVPLDGEGRAARDWSRRLYDAPASPTPAAC